MKRIYTFGHEQVERNITVGDIIQNKNNNKKMTQVTAANQEEAEIIAKENIDMIITGSDWYEDVRKGAPNTFITAALFAGRFITNEEILRGAFDVMMAGADSVLTPRSFDVVEMLAKEGMQVQGHVGMVPSMATKYGGIRTVGKTANEVEADWRGSTIIYTDSDFHLGSYSDKYQIISYNDEGEADVRMKIDFSAYFHRSTLKFTVEWDTDRVQKDTILQEKLVDLPTPLMGKIQAIFESIFGSETFDKTVEEPTISCMFDVRSHHSSECKPAVIDMLREAKRQASSEEE